MSVDIGLWAISCALCFYAGRIWGVSAMKPRLKAEWEHGYEWRAAEERGEVVVLGAPAEGASEERGEGS